MIASYKQQVVLINIIFRNSISRNITKCELGRFSLRRSHIILCLVTNPYDVANYISVPKCIVVT